jgi:hypothetical protein
MMSTLDDDDFGYAADEDDAASDGDICARCERTRAEHTEAYLLTSKCKKFQEQGERE